MAIPDLTISKSDIVAGQKVFSSQELARLSEIEAWANDQVAAKAMDLDSAQTATAKKTFSGGIDAGSKVISNTLDPVGAQDAATKASVAAAIAAVIPNGLAGLSDSNGEVSIGELQLKWGVITISAADTVVTFASEAGSAFTNSCFQGIACGGSSASGSGTTQVHTISKTAMTVRNTNFNSVTKIRWFAIGR